MSDSWVEFRVSVVPEIVDELTVALNEFVGSAFAIEKMSSVTIEALKANNISADDIDWFVPHQANKRIIDGTARKLGIAMEKVVLTIDKHANTSAASIPLALWTAMSDERIKTGDLVLIEALGGGMTWGSGLLRW